MLSDCVDESIARSYTKIEEEDVKDKRSYDGCACPSCSCFAIILSPPVIATAVSFAIATAPLK